jgi:hypothetical protein
MSINWESEGVPFPVSEEVAEEIYEYRVQAKLDREPLVNWNNVGMALLWGLLAVGAIVLVVAVFE